MLQKPIMILTSVDGVVERGGLVFVVGPGRLVRHPGEDVAGGQEEEAGRGGSAEGEGAIKGGRQHGGCIQVLQYNV